MEYSMQNNLLIISKNVIYKNLENTFNADVIELDTLTKIQKYLCMIQKIKLEFKV